MMISMSKLKSTTVDILLSVIAIDQLPTSVSYQNPQLALFS